MSSSGFPSIGEYYRRGPYKVYAQECRSAGHSPIDLVRVRQPAGSFPDPPLPALSVLMVVQGVMRTQVCLGDRPFTRLQRPGTFLVAPPDTACDYVVDTPHEFLVVAVPMSGVMPLLETAGARLSDLDSLFADTHSDAFLEALCRRLFEEAATANPLGSLFADHALVALLSTLVRLAGRKTGQLSRSKSLPAFPLQRVVAYMRDHLAETVSLADLAAVARVSVYHFARQFRGAMGESPHRYVIRLRVERAQQLLREGRLSMAQVASAVGFADQSHFNRHFKRLIGFTPGQFLQGGRRRQ
jgi:AraC family transcriptional regulator